MIKLPSIALPKVEYTREFAFNDADFERIRKLIYREAGIALNPSKKDMVYGRLVRRIRELKLSSFAAYLDQLESASGRREFEQFVNALTTNLTFFFREEHHFPILSEHLKKKAQQGGELAIWCAAASTGEEPYSIAMTALESVPGARVSITATDLDTTVLETGRKGIYPADKIARLPAGHATRFFDKQGDGSYQAKAALRSMISFSRLNLIDSTWPLRKQYDAIFCRNVMIYFDRDTQLAVLKKFAPLLKPDGLLFVGHSENFYFAADLFKLRGKTVYELAANGAGRSA
ncbi:MCP methyltransferase, CheR-type [Pseudogulbenkiania sp. NH8B]|uniref:Chemotaxis protein methyltransferase n=1 Tax=Pseudogulbenkiania ferrooxidans 2002 TaxID=279714 RepID=B9Z210_9NEIS|nr:MULTISPECIES: CheR family methyltransferase [Pseudogulbenkiania]EEG09455.1 MCP methyltransferase, CheR-type [Pseudogulbenkiania ferrooxidans 2002]BAK75486.1 MCP methyltransferase, CheR-type [Pseudogulbenkiania sp. NH8B]HSN39059.1 CheR family methyltransferase [Burkholderiales bacterium]